MNQHPKVSICIPAYNQTEYLAKTLDSILIQEYKNYEIIMTDDSTTDLVENLVKQYNFGEKLKYIRNRNRLGSPENWNEAIRNATGDYIKIIHHDDWFTSALSLAEFINMLDNNPSSDFAFSASHVILEDDNEWIHSITDEQIENIKTNPNCLYDGNLIGAPTATIFRNHKNIYFDPNLIWLVDLDFYIRQLKQNNSFIYCKQPLVVTFGAKGRITESCQNNKELVIFEYFYLFHKLIKEFGFFQLYKVKSNILFLVSVCNRYGIKNIKEVRRCGYSGEIHKLIIFYLFCKNNHLLFDRIFVKILKIYNSRN